MIRMYELFNTVEFKRPEFEAYLINYIHKNKLYNLRYLLGNGKNSVEQHVHHHPLSLAREIFGHDNVNTFEVVLTADELSFLGIDISRLNLR